MLRFTIVPRLEAINAESAATHATVDVERAIASLQQEHTEQIQSSLASAAESAVRASALAVERSTEGIRQQLTATNAILADLKSEVLSPPPVCLPCTVDHDCVDATAAV